MCYLFFFLLASSFSWTWSACMSSMTTTDCRSLFDTWYLWFMGLGKGWRNLIWLMMSPIFGILQKVCQKSTLLHTSVAPKGSSLSHVRYLIYDIFPILFDSMLLCLLWVLFLHFCMAKIIFLLISSRILPHFNTFSGV